MSLFRIISVLDSYLSSENKRKEALRSLHANGRISSNTVSSMEEKTSRIASLVSGLKEALEEEESLWKASLLEESSILEQLLVDLKFRHLLGEIGEEEWTRKSKIIDLGLTSLSSKETLTATAHPEPPLPAQPIQTTLEEHVSEEIETEEEDEAMLLGPTTQTPSRSRKPRSMQEQTTEDHRDSLDNNKPRKRISKEPPDLGSSSISKVRCMNPWKPECRDTDIELSIYYHGRLTPICRGCWEDISKKNIEWSSL